MANAGRVAIVPKGDYSSSVTYKRLDLVRYNDKAYVAKKASTGVLPTNTDYWMLMTSDGITIDSALSDTSTNPVQNKIIKTALDNIQTTSRATLSQAGWYRVAELESNRWWFSPFEIGVYKDNSGNNASSCKLRFVPTGGNVNVMRLEAISCALHGNNPTITKLRITTDGTKCYIEIYYSVSAKNAVGIVLNDSFAVIPYVAWRAITPTLTSETVDGVTVTTTYDIPTNASPVTTVDDTNMTGWIALTSGFDLNNAYGKYRTVTTSIVTSLLNLPSEVTGGEVTVEWFSSNATSPQSYGVQLLRNTNGKKVSLYIRCKTDGWSGWDCIATTADLANYFKNTGGEINGNVLLSSADAVTRYLRLKNSKRQITHQIGEDGSYYVTDNTNGKNIITSTADGTNTFNGTASGCLALDGGGTVKKANNDVLTLENTLNDYNYLRFKGASGLLGAFGFVGADIPVILNAQANKTEVIHHDGNSAKVVVSATAPSDTSSVWVDSANKATKVYIDGAWTALA